MNYEEVITLLPTFRQKLTVLILAIGGTGLVTWLVRKRRIREEHALFWFVGFGAGVLLVWIDPLLARLSYSMGIETPASALLLAAVFFLACLSIWFTSVASRNKQRIEDLIIHVSLLENQVSELHTSLHQAAGKETPLTRNNP